tara:strand:+ start:2455 stop:2712 length:258 start_codon:yes stop_codon:yes gene_type:complete
MGYGKKDGLKKVSGFKMAGMKFGEGTGSMLNKDKEGVVEVDANEMDMLNDMNTGVDPRLSKAIIDDMEKDKNSVMKNYKKGYYGA